MCIIRVGNKVQTLSQKGDGMTVGLKIKLLRTEKGLTQAELCDLTGLSSSTIVYLENDRKKAQVETLIRLNNVLTNGDEKVLLELIELNERK